jgi:glycosyltransferase 2 family protein
VVVLMFERARLAQAWRGRVAAPEGTVPPPPLSSSDQ